MLLFQHNCQLIVLKGLQKNGGGGVSAGFFETWLSALLCAWLQINQLFVCISQKSKSYALCAVYATVLCCCNPPPPLPSPTVSPPLVLPCTACSSALLKYANLFASHAAKYGERQHLLFSHGPATS